MEPSIPTFSTPERSAKISPTEASKTGPDRRTAAASHVTKKAVSIMPPFIGFGGLGQEE